MAKRQGYRKGDQHSGGGGSVGGGGKKGRPQGGWEKGDVARDVDPSDPSELPIKPGRDSKRKAELVKARRQRSKESRQREK